MRRLVLALCLILLFLTRTAAAQSCLHGPDESETERGRRTAAIAFVAQVNAAEAKLQRERGTYVALVDAVGMTTVPLGFVPRLTFDRWSYAISLKDVLDPCGFALFSDQDGLVFEARPLPRTREAERP